MGLLAQLQGTTQVEKDGGLILDIESLVQITDQSSGSPKIMGALFRKGPNRADRRTDEDVELDDGFKKVAAKIACSHGEQTASLVTVPNKTLTAQSATTAVTDAGEGRCCKRFNRITGIHPRKILLLFATMSSLGTMILIYLTLAIISHRNGGM